MILRNIWKDLCDHLRIVLSCFTPYKHKMSCLHEHLNELHLIFSLLPADFAWYWWIHWFIRAASSKALFFAPFSTRLSLKCFGSFVVWVNDTFCKRANSRSVKITFMVSLGYCFLIEELHNLFKSNLYVLLSRYIKVRTSVKF